MRQPFRPRRSRQSGLLSFTLIELLVVMGIIAILAGLILVAGNGVITKAKRSRATSEIQAMSTALEGYKTDNGIYPSTQAIALTTNIYLSTDPTTAAGVYQQTSQLLYQALSGQTNFLDTPLTSNKSYMSFKANQLGNTTTPAGTASSAGTATYVQDPFKTSYGYSTATNSTVTPYNGVGFFDLWSTGGQPVNGVSAAWLSNWQ